LKNQKIIGKVTKNLRAFELNLIAKPDQNGKQFDALLLVSSIKIG